MTNLRFGPVALEPGVTRTNAWALMYASFVTIGLATGMAAMTPYVLTANLGIAEADQGKALGALAVAQEIALIIAFGLFGALADKLGRRVVYALGLMLIAAGYFLFPFGRGFDELIAYRVIFAFGIGAATGMLATVISDYGAEQDRGKLTALCGFLNGLGIVVATTGIAKLPAYFVDRGTSEIQAGRNAMAVAAGVALVSALVLWLSLKRGVPPVVVKGKSALARLRDGFAAARDNKRIALAYASAFVARGDIAIVGLFAIAWGKQAAVSDGFSNADALSKGIIPFVIAQGTALLWPAVIAVPLDRMHRLSALAMCMALGCVGYCALVFVDDPLQPLAIPFFMALGIGQISAFLGAQTVIGKEAPAESRGAVIGLFNLSGAVGILVLTAVGGVLFDVVGPWAPFFVVGVLNAVIAVACLILKRQESAG